MKLSKIKKNKKYLLACSFGPDSMALFHLLNKKKYDFDVAFVNYHLRKESDAEMAGLKRYCQENNIKIFIKEVNYNKEENGNIEEWARNVRYNFFKDLFINGNYEAVLIAHNKDDLIETYLIQKMKDNHPSFFSLKEISFKDDVKYIRPLLKYRKKELEELIKNNKVPFMIDQSNFDNRYLRNYYRNEVIKKLSENDIKKIIKEIRTRNKNLKKENKLFNHYIDIKNKRIELKKIKQVNEDEFINLFYFYLRKCSIFIKKFSKEEIKDIYLKIKLNKNIKMKIKNDYFLYIEYSYLKIDRLYDFNYQFELTIEGNDVFKFNKENNRVKESFKNNDFLIIKNLSQNDKYLYLDKYKKINHILSDMKVPSSLRKIYPGVYNLKGELIYIPRYKEKFKITKNSFLLFKFKKIIELENI